MPDALTESFCERCGTRYELAAPARLTTMRRTRGVISGLKNFVLGEDSLADSVGDAMRSQDESLAAMQLDAFHASFNFCIECRQYSCVKCWNEAVGRCQSCAPLPGEASLGDRLEAALGDVRPDLGAASLNGDTASAIDLRDRSAWPASDLTEVLSDLPAAARAEPPWEPARTWAEVAQQLEPQAAAEPEPEAAAAVHDEPEPEPVTAEEPELEVVAAVHDEPQPEPVTAEEPELEVVAAVHDEPQPEPIAGEADVDTPSIFEEPDFAADSESTQGDAETAWWPETEAEPGWVRTAWDEAWEPAPAPQPSIVEAAAPSSIEPGLAPNEEPALVEAEDEHMPTVAHEPEIALERESDMVPEPMPAAAEIEPEPIAAEAEAESMPDAAETTADISAEDEPQAEAEAEAEPIPYRPLTRIGDTFLHYPASTQANQEIAAARVNDEAYAARRAQLDLLGLGDPGQASVEQAPPVVLPYRPAAAAARAEGGNAAVAAVGGAFWDASAREVAGALSQIGVRTCSNCDLSLSATARFCRRCGAPQAQSA